METAAHIVDALGGVTQVSEHLELPTSTVGTWRTRNSIPARHWMALIQFARDKRVTGITYESLTRMHAS